MTATSELKNDKKENLETRYNPLTNYAINDFNTGRKFYKFGKNYAKRLNFSESEFEDIYQEILLRNFQKDYYDPEKGNEATLLFTMIRYKLYDKLREKKRNPEITLSNLEGNKIDFLEKIISVDYELPEDKLIKTESSNKLDLIIFNAIPKLTLNQQGFVINHYFLKHPYKKISKKEGLPIGTVKSRGSAARKNLKSILNKTKGFYREDIFG